MVRGEISPLEGILAAFPINKPEENGHATIVVEARPGAGGLIATTGLAKAEGGYAFDAAYWFGLMAPAGTAPVVTPMNSKEFGGFIQSEMAKWRDAVRDARVKIE